MTILYFSLLDDDVEVHSKIKSKHLVHNSVIQIYETRKNVEPLISFLETKKIDKLTSIEKINLIFLLYDVLIDDSSIIQNLIRKVKDKLIFDKSHLVRLIQIPYFCSYLCNTLSDVKKYIMLNKGICSSLLHRYIELNGNLSDIIKYELITSGSGLLSIQSTYKLDDIYRLSFYTSVQFMNVSCKTIETNNVNLKLFVRFDEDAVVCVEGRFEKRKIFESSFISIFISKIIIENVCEREINRFYVDKIIFDRVVRLKIVDCQL